MASLKEEAQNYVQSKTKNIAELETVSVELNVMEESGETTEGKSYSFKYVEINGEKYRVPKSVLDGLQTMLKEKPNMLHFKVNKKGEGLATEYTVIPL